MNIIWGLLLALGGIWLIVRFRQNLKAVRHDQYGRRSTGGVLEYDSPAEADAAFRKAGIANAGAKYGGCFALLLIIGGVALIVRGVVDLKGRQREEDAAQIQEANLKLVRQCNAGAKDACLKLCVRTEHKLACELAGVRTSGQVERDGLN